MRALLITDSTLAAALAPGLREDGFVTDVIEPAAGAVSQAQKGSYDAVLLDCDHLAGQGYGWLLRWRRDGLRARVLVLLPPEARGIDMVNLFQAGADAYLRRPFAINDVRSRLRAFKRPEDATAGPVHRIHDLEINTATRTARRGDRAIRLSPREFDVLQLLANRPGRVVTRTAIREHLYRNQAHDRSNVVDVYIRYLRNKIDKGFDPPLILTRWGEGYLLRAPDA
jgi:DNA-binding response OmpR family regulator